MSNRMRFAPPGLSWAFQKDTEQPDAPAQDPNGATEKEAGRESVTSGSSEELLWPFTARGN